MIALRPIYPTTPEPTEQDLKGARAFYNIMYGRLEKELAKFKDKAYGE